MKTTDTSLRQRLSASFSSITENADGYGKSRLFYIAQAAFEYFCTILVTGAYLARLTSTLGFSDSLTGILSAFVSLSSSFQLGALFMFRKRSSVKKPVVTFFLIHELLFASLYLLPIFEMNSIAKMVIFVVFFMTSHLLLGLITPHSTTWLMSIVPDEQRGSFTATKEIISLLGGMIFSFVMGNLIDGFEAKGDTRATFIAGTVALLIMTALNTLSMISIKDKPIAHAEEETHENRFAFLKNRMLWKVIIFLCLRYVAVYVSTPFYGSYEINELGFSMTFVSILSILYSVIRSLASPAIGRYADRTSFGHSSFVCMILSVISYLFIIFCVPENGAVFYTIYYVLTAVSHAGLNSALINLLFDFVPKKDRRNALSIAPALYGLVGFATTCAAGPLISYIQAHNGVIFGMKLYAQQFVSVIALVISLFLVVYVYIEFIKKKPYRIGREE